MVVDVLDTDLDNSQELEEVGAGGEGCLHADIDQGSSLNAQGCHESHFKTPWQP